MTAVKPIRIIGKAKLNARKKELMDHAAALLHTAAGTVKLNRPGRTLDLIRGAQDCLIRIQEVELCLKVTVK
jgi:hypothetical protein